MLSLGIDVVVGEINKIRFGKDRIEFAGQIWHLQRQREMKSEVYVAEDCRSYFLFQKHFNVLMGEHKAEPYFLALGSASAKRVALKFCLIHKQINETAPVFGYEVS